MSVLRRAGRFAWVAILAGCASAGVEELHPLAIPAEPRPRSEVRFYPTADKIPFAFTRIAIFTPRRLRAFNEATVEPYLLQSARRGGNALFVDTAGKRPLLVAAYVDTTARRWSAKPIEAPRIAHDGSTGRSSMGGDSSGGCQGSCTVHVRGYTRKDGTYVRPHTRSAPRSDGGRRH